MFNIGKRLPNSTSQSKTRDEEDMTAIRLLLLEIREHQVNELELIQKLQQQQVDLQNKFAQFLQLANSSNRAYRNIITGLQTQLADALAKPALDAAQIANLQSQNQQLVDAAAAHDGTVSSQLTSLSASFDSMETALADASAQIAPPQANDVPPQNNPVTTANADAKGTDAPPTSTGSGVTPSATDTTSATTVSPAVVETPNTTPGSVVEGTQSSN